MMLARLLQLEPVSALVRAPWRVCDGAGDLTVALWRFASLRLAPVSIRMCPLGFPQNTSHVPLRTT